MEASTLRWILVIVGVLVIGSVWLFGSPSKKRKPKASRRSAEKAAKSGAERREPTLDGAAPGSVSMDEMAADAAVAGNHESGGQGELPIGAAPDAEPMPAPKPKAPPKSNRPPGPPPEKIVTLFLLSHDNHVITGAELLQAAVSTGMEFGDMQIFHRLPEGSETPVFSMANAAKPGYFERDEWNTFETSGVALFMALPGPVQALDGWDSMLATARRMSEILHAELLDDERNPFTRQREAQMREEMREFDRRKKASG